VIDAPVADTADQEDADTRDVRHVLGGDPSAFEGIVERWQGRLVNLAWRFCRDRMAAEDMAQDAFVRAYRTLHTFRGESAFATWLTSVALNCYRSWLRHRSRAWTGALPATLIAAEPDAFSSVHERERAEAIRGLVATLPRRYREAVVLYYFEEMDVAATARLLGIPTGTLKARLSRARALLRQRYAARFAEGPREDHGRS
jgi:RNA polymerase sigma-70 factor (ECF subfamily)